MRKIVVASIKGGVGKMTVSSGLTCGLKRLGFSVGFLDADIAGGIGRITYLVPRQESTS